MCKTIGILTSGCMQDEQFSAFPLKPVSALVDHKYSQAPWYQFLHESHTQLCHSSDISRVLLLLFMRRCKGPTSATHRLASLRPQTTPCTPSTTSTTPSPSCRGAHFKLSMSSDIVTSWCYVSLRFPMSRAEPRCQESRLNSFSYNYYPPFARVHGIFNNLLVTLVCIHVSFSIP